MIIVESSSLVVASKVINTYKGTTIVSDKKCAKSNRRSRIEGQKNAIFNVATKFIKTESEKMTNAKTRNEQRAESRLLAKRLNSLRK
jgi:hypothetical protein